MMEVQEMEVVTNQKKLGTWLDASVVDWSLIFGHCIPNEAPQINLSVSQHIYMDESFTIRYITCIKKTNGEFSFYTDLSEKHWCSTCVCSPKRRSSLWATVLRASGWLSAWKAAMWRCSTTPNLTSTSYTFTRAAFSLSSLPTVVSG